MKMLSEEIMSRLFKQSAAVFVAIFIFASCASLQAQTPILEEPGYTPTLTFDIVVIRQSPPPDANFRVSVSSTADSSRFEAKNLPMKALLQIAYGFEAPVVGAPEWVNTTFFDILAHSDEEADARLKKLTPNEVRLEKRNAIRAMLADRLGLKTHLETRNSAVYHLVLAKGGLKMEVAPAPPAPENGERPAPPVGDTAAHGSQHGLEFDGTRVPMVAISSALSAMVQEPVINKTGLTGIYNYKLQFGREWSANDPESWPSILTAVQEQLGLKLESLHEDVPNLVVDHITKPTEN
jgi:uncharacterized protein (TIGR03435 family)